MDVDQESFVSALTLVLDHSTALSSLAIDNTPVDDPSLRALASSSNSRTLQLLRMKSCPRVSPGGIVALADHCRCLRELSLSYTLLSDELLLALSSERHVRLEYLRLDVHTEKKEGRLGSISPHCWQALEKHSPSMSLVIYVFVVSEECKYCPKLRELVVGAHTHGGALADTELLSIAAHCPHLAALGLAECELSVMEESLLEDSNYDLAKTCRTVSELLGRDWTPEFSPVW
ncbi:hypothetical protein B566_EDAN001861 [Ephemera danica]|nr:hypothetical protein B566_EDAN001861 [Ephemera danica]